MYHNVNNLQPTLFNKHNFEENKIISKTNKAREEITPNKSIKTPCFVPNTFQDFIEKLNEKSGLWRRKYLIISLSIRKIFFYEKKPSKEDEPTKANGLDLSFCEFFTCSEFQEKHCIKKNHVLLLKIPNQGDRLIISFKNDKNLKHVSKIINEIKEASKKDFHTENFLSANNQEQFYNLELQKNYSSNKLINNNNKIIPANNIYNPLKLELPKQLNYAKQQLPTKNFTNFSNDIPFKENINPNNSKSIRQVSNTNIKEKQYFIPFNEHNDFKNEFPELNNNKHRKTNSMHLDISPCLKEKVYNEPKQAQNLVDCRLLNISNTNKLINLEENICVNNKKEIIELESIENKSNITGNQSLNQSFEINREEAILNLINANKKTRNYHKSKSNNLKLNFNTYSETNIADQSLRGKKLENRQEYVTVNTNANANNNYNPNLSFISIDEKNCSSSNNCNNFSDRKYERNDSKYSSYYKKKLLTIKRNEKKKLDLLHKSKEKSTRAKLEKPETLTPDNKKKLGISCKSKKIIQINFPISDKSPTRSFPNQNYSKSSLAAIDQNKNKNQSYISNNPNYKSTNKQKELDYLFTSTSCGKERINLNKLRQLSKERKQLNINLQMKNKYNSDNLPMNSNKDLITFDLDKYKIKEANENRNIFEIKETPNKNKKNSDYTSFINEENSSLAKLINKLIVNSYKKSNCSHKTDSFYDRNGNLSKINIEESFSIDLKNDEAENLQMPNLDNEKKIFFCDRSTKLFKKFYEKITLNIPHSIKLESDKKLEINNEKKQFKDKNVYIPTALNFDLIEKQFYNLENNNDDKIQDKNIYICHCDSDPENDNNKINEGEKPKVPKSDANEELEINSEKDSSFDKNILDINKSKDMNSSFKNNFIKSNSQEEIQSTTNNNLTIKPSNAPYDQELQEKKHDLSLKLSRSQVNTSNAKIAHNLASSSNSISIQPKYNEILIKKISELISNSEEFIFDSYILKQLLKKYKLKKSCLGNLFKFLREGNEEDVFHLQLLTEMMAIISKKLLTKSVLKSLEILHYERMINPDYTPFADSKHSIEYCICDIFNTFLGKNEDREEFYFKILPNLLKDEFNLDFCSWKIPVSIFKNISLSNLFVIMQYHNQVYFNENLDINFNDKTPFVPQDIKFIASSLLMKWNAKASTCSPDKENYRVNNSFKNKLFNCPNLSRNNTYVIGSVSNNSSFLVNHANSENKANKYDLINLLPNNEASNNNENSGVRLKEKETFILNTNMKRIKNKNLKFDNENGSFDINVIIKDMKHYEENYEEQRIKLVKSIDFYLGKKAYDISLKLCDFYVQKFNETIFLNPIIYIILAEIYNLNSGIDLARLFYEKALNILDWQYPDKSNPVLIDVYYTFSLILLKNINSEDMLLEIESLLEDCLGMANKFYKKENEKIIKVKMQLIFLKILKTCENIMNKPVSNKMSNNENPINQSFSVANQQFIITQNEINSENNINYFESLYRNDIQNLLEQFDTSIRFLMDTNKNREACVYLNFFLDLIKDYSDIFNEEIIQKISLSLHEAKKKYEKKI